MPLFEALPVARDAVADAARAQYGLELQEQLKASQNTTFAAVHPGTGRRYALRATADADGAKHARICAELALVAHLAAAGEPAVCAPLPPLCARQGGLTMCAVAWAEGAPLDFGEMRWLTDGALVRAWGATLACLHAGARAFAAAQPAAAAALPRWDALHGGLMAGVEVHPEDAAAECDPARFGILHGDLNVSNFFVVEAPAPGDAPPALRVFDWDQAQRGWWEYDLAQAALAALMLAEGGALPGGEPEPRADVEAFLAQLVAGYEAVAGAGAVHGARLRRMLALRKAFYARFCKQAAAEGGAPPDMAWFVDYVNRWMARAPPSVT
jgi:Ser/Thr protein kinase RdoA (MazF antagonist)